jgi:mRNA-degrading endonuclease RelE of RelBE toxin-antitoxin system
MYKLFETDEFLRSIEKLQKRDKALIKKKTEGIRVPPNKI